jgi:hypothetical protein
MTNKQRGIAALQVVWIVAGVLVIAAAAWQIAGNVRGSSVDFSTPYQAVLLTNGSVYFGRLQGYGSPHPVLTDIYYIVTQTTPQEKPEKPGSQPPASQVNNILVKRGKELHEPDRMYLNPEHILFVEPVGANSKVAQLIVQAQAGK